MAMPTSGCLHLCDPTKVSECRSIAHAVYPGGSIPVPTSLRNAGIYAGFSGSISHSCFYGYAPSPASLTFIVYISGGFDVDYIGGSYSLRISGPNTIIQTRNVSTGTEEDYFVFDSVPAGSSYYIDFSSIIAYNVFGGSIQRSISWELTPAGTTGTSNSTSSMSTSQTIHATVDGGIIIKP